MQYHHEDDLFNITSELTDTAQRVIWINMVPNDVVFIGHQNEHLSIYNIKILSADANNHSYLEKHIEYLREHVDWHEISIRTTNLKLLRNNLAYLDWTALSSNPNVLELLEENIDKLDWMCLSRNPGAIPIIESHMDRVYIEDLCINPNAIHLLEKCPLHDLNFHYLAQNHNAFHLITKHISDIIKNNGYQYFYYIMVLLAQQPVPYIVEYIIDNMWIGDTSYGEPSLALDTISESFQIWLGLFKNPCAVPFLEKHKDRIDWDLLAYNPNALHLLKEHVAESPYPMCWERLGNNQHACWLISTYNETNTFDRSTVLKTAYRLTCIANTHTKWAVDTIDKWLRILSVHHMGYSWNRPHSDGWRYLSKNPKATALHDTYAEYLVPDVYIGHNTVITSKYVYMYSKMKQIRKDLNQEIISNVHHPRNLHRLYTLGFDEFEHLDPNIYLWYNPVVNTTYVHLYERIKDIRKDLHQEFLSKTHQHHHIR